MKIEQSYIPDFKFCPVCGTECKTETCSPKCRGTLQTVRNTIANQTEIEKHRSPINSEWTPRQIKAFNYLQELIEG